MLECMMQRVNHLPRTCLRHQEMPSPFSAFCLRDPAHITLPRFIGVFVYSCLRACLCAMRPTEESLLLCNSVTPLFPFLLTEIALALTYVRVQICPCPLLKACTSSPNLFLLLEIAPAARQGATAAGYRLPRIPRPARTRDDLPLIA